MDSLAEPGLKKRLIVLVPEGLAGNPDLAHKIYWMAIRDRCDVLYLAYVYDEEKRLEISRSMATMKALTSGNLVMVNLKQTGSDDWLDTLRELYRPGDIIVCHEGQYVRQGFLNTVSVKDLLSSIFKTPVTMISGFYHPWQLLSRKWLFGLLFWIGCLVILSAFTLLEIQVDRTVQGAAGTVLIFVILAFEFGSIVVLESYSQGLKAKRTLWVTHTINGCFFVVVQKVPFEF